MAAIAALASLGSFNSAHAQITFTPLVGLGTANDISNDGSVVVGGGDYWTSAAGAVSLSPFGGDATGVSSNGSVVVGTALFPDRQIAPFKWTEAGGFNRLPGLNGATDSRALGVSGDGSTTVGFSDPSIVATKWVGTTPHALAPLPGGSTESVAQAISTDGSTIVGYANNSVGRAHAVRWTDSGPLDLGTLGGFNSLATGVSADGTYIIGYVVPTATSPVVNGFIWNAFDGKTDLSLVGRNVVPEAVSADGSLVIGYTQRAGDPLHGFVWTPETGVLDFSSVLTLDFGLKDQLNDWSNLYPRTMTDDGRFIAGTGLHDGVAEAWLIDRGATPPPIESVPNPPLSPVPEPSTYGAIGSLLLLGLAGWRHKKRRSFASS